MSMEQDCEQKMGEETFLKIEKGGLILEKEALSVSIIFH